MTSTNHFAAAAFLLMLSAGAADFNRLGRFLTGSGPRLFYDFETYNEDGSLKDLSGNGHEGRLNGGFTKASRDGLNGLLFNGKDTMIVPDDAAELKMTGPMSIYLKIRIEPDWGSKMGPFSPLVFGSTDGLGANRNYSLFFDHGHQLAFDIGNGSFSNTLSVNNVADGQLHTFVFMVANNSVMAYCDGKCVTRQDGANVLPNKEIGLQEIKVGSWHAGFLLGELYELALFDRPLSNREVLSFSGLDGRSLSCNGEFTFKHSDFRRRLSWKLACENVSPTANSLELRVDGATAWRKALTTEDVAGERLVMVGELDTSSFTAGRYNVEIRIMADNGDVVFSKTEQADIRNVENKELYINDIGVSDEVLPPWTPMEVVQRDGKTEVSVWNRKYTFGDEPLSCDIYSGAALSVKTAYYNLSIDGVDIQLAPNRLQLLKSTPSKTVLLQSAGNDDVELSAMHTVEYDGFSRIKVKLTAKHDLVVDKLHFIYPLNHKYIKATIRELNQAMAISGEQGFGFIPVLFMGDEERGLSYLADSDQNWYPVGNPNALQLKPLDGKETVVFEIHPIDEKVTMKANETFEYEFALTATPIRPMTESAWTKRCVNIRPYCGEMTCTVDQRGGKSIFDYYADAGMRSFIIWRNDKAFGYPPLPGTAYSDGVKRLVAKAHAKGISAFPYAIGFLYSELAPEWNESRLFTYMPGRDFSSAGDFLEKETGVPQHTWWVCNNRYYQNLMLYRLREAILETGMDGVYLDGTVNSRLCMDELHGCGYVGKDGNRHATYNGFATRDFLKRIHTLVYQLKGDKGVVDLHFSVAYNAPAAAWATSLWSGENLGGGQYAFKNLSPEGFRLAYTGTNIGVASELLHFTMHTSYRAASALALVHGVPVRPHDAEDIDEIAELWRQRERLGCDEAEFIGYWKADCPVVSKTPGIYASCYVRKDSSVVAIVSNLTEQRKVVELSSRKDGFAMPAPFELDSQDFRFVEIGK